MNERSRPEQAEPSAGTLRHSLAILGSCVSRDTIEFGENLEVVLYCARQSVASLAAPRLRDDVLSQLVFKEGTGSFHQRSIEQDVTKSALIRLEKLPSDIPILIDLIEERVPLGRSPCGSLVTLSETATKYSNLMDLVVEVIEPWSAQHLMLFEAALPVVARALNGRQVVIHRAFYAEDKRSFSKINSALAQLYDRLAAALPWAQVIEPPETLRLGENEHSWGPGPYHYVDVYYQAALTQTLCSLGWPVVLRPGFSRRKDLMATPTATT